MIRSDEPCPVCGDKLYPVIWDGRDVGVQCAGGICDWPGRLTVMLEKEHDSVTPEGEVGMQVPEGEEMSEAELFEKLGWDGQLKLVEREALHPIHPVDKFVYDMLLPHSKKIQDFDSFLLPGDVPEKIQPYLEEGFDYFMVQYDQEKRAGVILGVKQHPSKSWVKEHFGIVEWGLPGEESGPFVESRLDAAKVVAFNRMMLEALEVEGKIEALIEYLKMGVHGKPLNFFMSEDGSRKTFYLSAPSV